MKKRQLSCPVEKPASGALVDQKAEKVTVAVRSLGIADWRSEVEEEHADTENGGNKVGLIENGDAEG